jgi:glycosyltransferase involved in cell wall biosynthesis
MDIALYHDLPQRGGAFRVLASFVAGAAAEHRLTLYTPRPAGTGQIALDLDRVVRLSRPGGGRPFSPRWLAMAPVAGRAFARRIDAAGHDVVFCHSSEYAKAPELLPFLGTPSLYYAPEPHRILYDGRSSNRAEAAAKWRLRVLDRRAIRAATAVVTHSHWTATNLHDVYGVRAEVVAPGVDLRAFVPGPPPRTPAVLSVGSLTPLKGHELVIEALATLGPGAPRLVVVGDAGDGEAALRELARRRDVQLDVKVGVSDASLLAEYQAASVVACGQREEPFGLVVLEAMATATPVVAVAEGGFLETIEHGVTGLLVPRDPAAMGAAIARALDEPELASRARARLKSWERTTAGYLDLLNTLSR